MGERSRSLSVVLSEGYAPYEQYHRRGEQGPWTEIYACAAQQTAEDLVALVLAKDRPRQDNLTVAIFACESH